MSCSTRNCWAGTCPSATERGQTAVEFVFVLLILIAGMAGLYQVLHFERDVFNRLLFLRKAAMRDLHRDQDITPKTLGVVGPAEFRPFGKLLNSPVPLQVIDPNIRYSPRVLQIRRGTRYYEPFPFDSELMHNWLVIGGTMSFTETNQNSARWRAVVGPWIIPAYPDPLN